MTQETGLCTWTFGRVMLGANWASDGGWDWTSDVGDQHRDLLALVVLRRPGQPPLLRLSIGPLFVGVIVADARRRPGEDSGAW